MKPLFEWGPELSVRVKEFDGHHQRIIDLINKLHTALNRGDVLGVTREVLTELSNYTIYHFMAEEELMEKHRYPGYARHREEHLALTAKTLYYVNEAYGNNRDLGREVLDFLVAWLKNHILITDKQYTAFFAERGIS